MFTLFTIINLFLLNSTLMPIKVDVSNPSIIPNLPHILYQTGDSYIFNGSETYVSFTSTHSTLPLNGYFGISEAGIHGYVARNISYFWRYNNNSIVMTLFNPLEAKKIKCMA